jgi:hypothetical protein
MEERKVNKTQEVSKFQKRTDEEEKIK